jgi:hypothetical protein
VTRPWASRTENDAEHVAPGAFAVQLAVTDVADATANATPTHAPVGRTSTTSTGVRGSGLTSPGTPTTAKVQEPPLAWVHSWAIVPPWGRLLGAAPTRSRRRVAGVSG